eukprot:10512581-Alexandrium_andersonii.AAC.1
MKLPWAKPGRATIHVALPRASAAFAAARTRMSGRRRTRRRSSSRRRRLADREVGAPPITSVPRDSS